MEWNEDRRLTLNAGLLVQHAGEFAGDESDLVAHASGGFVIMQHADDGFSREAERQQTTTRIERESFSTFNANERSEPAQLTGDVRRLALELHGILLG